MNIHTRYFAPSTTATSVGARERKTLGVTSDQTISRAGSFHVLQTRALRALQPLSSKPKTEVRISGMVRTSCMTSEWGVMG